ncbi:MAG: LmeA family phospholipid-binding protein [Acidimicrobiales bacterium]
MAAVLGAAGLGVLGSSVVLHRAEGRALGCFHPEGLRVGLGGPVGILRLLVGLGTPVSAQARSVKLNGLTLRDVRVSAEGVHVGAWRVLLGQDHIQAARVSAQLTLTDADLNAALRADHLPIVARFSSGGVSGVLQVAGIDLGQVDGSLLVTGDGREVRLRWAPSILPRLINLSLAPMISLVHLPSGVTIDRLGILNGRAFISLQSSRPFHADRCNYSSVL